MRRRRLHHRSHRPAAGAPPRPPAPIDSSTSRSNSSSSSPSSGSGSSGRPTSSCSSASSPSGIACWRGGGAPSSRSSWGSERSSSSSSSTSSSTESDSTSSGSSESERRSTGSSPAASSPRPSSAAPLSCSCSAAPLSASCVAVGRPWRGSTGVPGWRGRRSLARLRLRATERSGQVSAFRGEACGTCTSGSTCAAEAAPGCSACSCWFDSCVACTLHTRELQRSEHLHEPCRALPSGMVKGPATGPRARERTPPGANAPV